MRATARWIVGTVVLGASGVLAYAAVPERSSPFDGAPPATERDAHSIFAARSRGWYWVYESVAHAQSFVARGTRIHGLWLRPAQLNATRPTAPLRVEVRDPHLKQVFAQGLIKAEDIDREFRWMPVELTFRAPLTAGQPYVLLLQSPESSHDAPWVVNAVYKDRYPDGRHLGYADDLLFRMTFEAHEVRVGPALNVEFDTPVNSGMKGAPARSGATELSARYPRVKEAASDPIGPIPRGLKELARTKAR